MSELPMMSVKEAAEHLNVSQMTIYRAVNDGTLPHIKIRRSIRIPREALNTLSQEPAKKPTTLPRVTVTRL